MNTNNDELLNFIINNAMIDIDDVQQQMNQNKKEEFVSESHTYQIWQGSNGRWYTYLPDETRPKGRRQIAKACKELIIDTVYHFYHQKEIQSIMTLGTLYPEWLQYKSLHTKSTNSIRRIDDDWRRFYINDPIINVPITKLDKLTLDTWIHTLVQKHKMTKVCYYNMSLIIRQSLHYAVDKKLILSNPFADIKIDLDMFHAPAEKKDETQVFLVDEVKPIIDESRNDFMNTGNLAALAVPFAFQTGARLGELVAINLSDIRGRYLHIQRMEIKEQRQDMNGKWLPADRTVVERTKSKAGKRKIYLTDEAMSIINAAINEIKENGYSDEDYLFQDIRGRVSSRAVDSRIRKYCDHINISQKSTHKIRKTYISTLIDAGININKIRQTVGHESTKTTYGNYCYNRYSQEQTEEQFEKALKI